MKNTLYDHVTLAYHACKLLFEYLENQHDNPFEQQAAQNHMLYVQTHNYLKSLKEIQERENNTEKRRK